MRHLIIAAAATAALLAGCSGSNTMSGSTVDRETISPNRPGMGQGATRESLPDPGRIPGAATPNSRAQTGQVIEPNPTMSPNRPGMGYGTTRESLMNPDKAGSGASNVTPDVQDPTISPNRHGMGQSTTRRSLPNPGTNQ